MADAQPTDRPPVTTEELYRQYDYYNQPAEPLRITPEEVERITNIYTTAPTPYYEIGEITEPKPDEQPTFAQQMG
jgi:hypothetical protein